MDPKLQVLLIQHYWFFKCSWVCTINVYFFTSFKKSETSDLFIDLFPSPQHQYKLESDPMCGKTTGGREECFWNCEVGPSGLQEGLFKGFLLANPDCLLGCFPEVNV